MRDCFTPEVAKDMIPSLQAIGRQMLRSDWWIECEADGVTDPPLIFYSSRAVAEEMAPDPTEVVMVEATEFARAAGVIA
jgi:hypothetical protein